MIPVEFKDVVLQGVDGQPLSVTPQSVLVSIMGDAAAPTEAAAIMTATATVPPTMAPTVTPLPTPLPALPASGITPGLYYHIQEGETLYRLAYRYGTTPAAIAEANGISNVTNIASGTLLRIPVQPANGQALYIVTPGDTFYQIAATFGLSVQELAARNPLVAPHYVQPGQWIVLLP